LGNYFFQKLVDRVDDEQMKIILSAFKDSKKFKLDNNLSKYSDAAVLISILRNSFGTRSLQKLVEFICTNENQLFFINTLSGLPLDAENVDSKLYPSNSQKPIVNHSPVFIKKGLKMSFLDILPSSFSHFVYPFVKMLVLDPIGNHIIQKSLTSFQMSNIMPIITTIINDCLDLSTHKHGCCVVQRCLEIVNIFNGGTSTRYNPSSNSSNNTSTDYITKSYVSRVSDDEIACLIKLLATILTNFQKLFYIFIYCHINY
jgi:hypothetical protein